MIARHRVSIEMPEGEENTVNLIYFKPPAGTDRPPAGKVLSAR